MLPYWFQVLRKLPPSLAILAAFVIASASDVRAQSYAPETFFHDPVQRVFPVELARVLAWRENIAANADITEIKYSVNCASGGSAEWTFRWLDARGETWREAQIRYEAPLLRSGAQFYREVTRQFLQARWAPFESAQTGEIENAFWEGQDCLGMSRLATVRAAKAEESALHRTGDAAAAARQGGHLLVCALPGMTRMITLDSTLAARGAAWFALAQSAVGSEAGAERPWASVLWLARRQNQAREVWHGHGAGGKTTQPAAVSTDEAVENQSANVAIDWWRFIFSPHTPREARLQAGRIDSPAWGVAMLYSSVPETSDVLSFARCLKLVADIEYEAAHDYVAEIQERAIWRFNWDTLAWFHSARREWLAALRSCGEKEIGAIPGVFAALEKASAPSANDLSKEKTDAFLVGFREAAELVRAGYHQGSGTLAPVATVTARDLLNHGWEFFGIAFAQRYHFMQSVSENDPEPAAFLGRLLGLFPEFGVFLHKDKWDPNLPRISNINRLQRVEVAGYQLSADFDASFGVFPRFGQVNPQRAAIMAQRSWLMREHLTWSFWGVAAGNADPKQMSAFLHRLADEGGPLMDYGALTVITNPVNTAIMARIPDIDDLRKRFARDIQPSYMPWIWVLCNGQTEGMTSFERAQHIERIYWQGVAVPGLVGESFAQYQRANAIDDIKRLHKRLAGEVFHHADYANNVANGPYIIALYENDGATAREITGRMNAGPITYRWIELYYALMFGNVNALEKLCKDRQIDMPSDPFWQTAVPGLIELWRGLSGNSIGEGRRALLMNYAKQEKPLGAEILWLFARRLNLSGDEAALLFNREPPVFLLENSAYAAYYRDDREAFKTALVQLEAQKAYTSVNSYLLLQNLRRKLLEIPPVENTADPRPADWKPIEDELLDVILKRIQSKSTATSSATHP
ncbi:hypothetical protein CKA38_11825 [Ereboglobus luteus]|uniref:Uncharacterized protein n=1 Tax=Ereboglobus luteus TaxID=1796921 RepID=A0A2U8E513_9BACT|nr:hypothetical protein CKA38_11825 [Ereboglobus luteus]